MKTIRQFLLCGVAATAALLTSCTGECGCVGEGDCCPPEGVTEEVALCDCGMVKGSEGCCAEDAERCTDCGKIKGSAGCCK